MKYIFIFFAIFIFGTFLLRYHVTQTGERTGTIIKVADEGMFIKTHEAEMIKGGMNVGSGGFGVAPFFFTIRDEKLFPVIQQAFDSGKEVTIKYHQELSCVIDSEGNKNHDGGKCYYLDGVK